ncbi:nucleoside deaminase [Ructibacterium gallinarum]|uniref:tRNA-specific adenosine deaminase n=1 Tax=Ructibacterium gallinarum TaxID=2779355 RepID=A0A9D5R8R2_9FIRM|nr:nucleoside deaminase [Ructibacterium gallinarum]MBE5040242.1 nucleoside deaminase [Ructibacterium gallinarum]
MENFFMRAALEEAEKAFAIGEIPVGAVVVRNGEMIARGHNLREQRQNALSHAETEVIFKACERLGTWRLSDCDLYVTLEPCAMCCGAIAQAKMRRVYFGAYDPKGGFAVSNACLLEHPGLMHRTEYYCGIMEEECRALLRRFFDQLRREENKEK